MKTFFQKHKSFFSIFIVVMMVVQLLLPVFTSSAYAEESFESPTEGEVADEFYIKSDTPTESEVPDDSKGDDVDDELEPENSEENIVIFSAGGVQPLSGETDLGSGIFTDVKVAIDGNELPSGSVTEVDITDGLQLQVTLDWALNDDVVLEAGDWAELQLPASLSGVSGPMTGSLKDGNGTTVGTYEITSEGKLKVVFNDELVGKEGRDGEVGLLLKFDVTEFKDDVIQKIDFGEEIGKDFTFKVKPTGQVYDIDKKGVADAQINPTYIDWTVDVNTKLESLTDGNVIDTIPAGLVLDEASVEIYELTVGSEGKLTEGSQVTPQSVSTTGGVLEVGFGATDKAYRIKYKTNFDGQLNKAYTNTATLNDENTFKAEAIAIVEGLSKGSPIEKTGKRTTATSNFIDWTIDINKSESSLENVQVLDTLPAGLDLENITIYELNKSGSIWNLGTEVTGQFLGTVKKFPIVFGDIDSAYRIIVRSEIDYAYFDNYTKEHTFENTAILEVNGTNEDYDTAKVTIDRGTVLEKSGEETTSYGDSIISWTLNVNKAKQTITGATITDTIGAGLELIESTIVVKNVTKGTTLVAGTGYTFTENVDGTFTIALGDITDEFNITYDTKITNALSEGQTGYSNTGELSGDSGLGGEGVDPGDTEKEAVVKPSVVNTYTKTTSTGIKVDDITYDGLNYAEKTMSWLITVDTVKEEVTELTITDSFSPDKTMKLIPGTLRIVSGVGNSNILSSGTDYVLKDNGVGGFEIEFIGGHKPLQRAQYRIYYKTTFYVDEVLTGGGEVNSGDKYTNTANFKGKTTDHLGNVRDLDTTAQAYYQVATSYFNQGLKKGDLNRENRTIEWQIYTNMQGRDLRGAPFVITDRLTTGDQTVKQATVSVKTYSLDKSGDAIPGADIDPDSYQLVHDADGKGFKITFANGVAVPVYVSYETQINGLSEALYENEAVVTDKTGIEKKYEGAVTFDDHDKFVDKQALNADGKNVYTDDDLEWQIALNESLSDIKDAVFSDTISDGLVLLRDSIKVYEGSIDEANLVTLDASKIIIVNNPDGTTSLDIDLGNISGRYFVAYTTVVTASGVKVSNKASLTGEGEELGSSSSKEFDAKQSSWGTGTGNLNRGGITVVKVDKDNNQIKLPGVKFELYYFLEGEERVIGGERATDANGELVYGDLPFRTYYLREVGTLEGYKPLGEEIEFVLNTDNRIFSVTVENKKKPDKTYAIGDYTWIDLNKDGIQDAVEPVLEGVIVELFDKDGNRLAGTTTDEHGRYIFDELEAGEYQVKFTLTEEQAKIYEFTKQNSGSDSTVDSDADPITGWTVVIKLDDDNTSLTKDYEDQDFKATEGIDPTWDAGVIVKEKTHLTVNKVWRDGNSSSRPLQVWVFICRNGEPYGETIILNDSNNWTYTWKDLDASYKWTVDEAGLRNDYTKTIYGSGTEYTIVNEKAIDSVPITGDDSNSILLILLMSLSVIGMGVTWNVLLRIRKQENK